MTGHTIGREGISLIGEGTLLGSKSLSTSVKVS